MDVITYALSKKYTDESLSGAGAIKGKDGESAYQIAIKNGFLGTEQEWLQSLEGNDGAPGANGISPIVEVKPIPEGNEVTFIDAEGAKTIEIKNGSNDGSLSYITEVKLIKDKWTDNIQKISNEIFKEGEQYIYTVSPVKENELLYTENGVEAIEVDDTGMTFKCSKLPSADLFVKINRTESQVIKAPASKNLAKIKNATTTFDTLDGRKRLQPLGVTASVEEGKTYEISFHYKIIINELSPNLQAEKGTNFYIWCATFFDYQLVKIYLRAQEIGKIYEGDCKQTLVCKKTDLSGNSLNLLEYDSDSQKGTCDITNLSVIESLA